MSPRAAIPDPDPRKALLRRSDQLVVAILVAIATGLMGGYWVTQGGLSGRLIELERAPRHAARFQVDVNNADWPEFSVLPGVGETLARRIVESRGTEGPFADLEELRRVRGIGPKTLERMRPYLRPIAPSDNVARQ